MAKAPTSAYSSNLASKKIRQKAAKVANRKANVRQVKEAAKATGKAAKEVSKVGFNAGRGILNFLKSPAGKLGVAGLVLYGASQNPKAQERSVKSSVQNAAERYKSHTGKYPKGYDPKTGTSTQLDGNKNYKEIQDRIRGKAAGKTPATSETPKAGSKYQQKKPAVAEKKAPAKIKPAAAKPAPAKPTAEKSAPASAKPARQQGGSYVTYKKDSEGANSFRDKFKTERKKQGAGGKFTWDGREYTTDMASDKKKKPAPKQSTSTTQTAKSGNSAIPVVEAKPSYVRKKK